MSELTLEILECLEAVFFQAESIRVQHKIKASDKYFEVMSNALSVITKARLSEEQ